MAGRDRDVQPVDEVVERDVLDHELGLQLLRGEPNRADQVRLAQPGRAVDEQRVVARARRLRDGAAGRDREAVGRADDVVVEPKSAIQKDTHRPAATRGAVAPLNRRSTSSEMLRKVSKTPVPRRASPA